MGLFPYGTAEAITKPTTYPEESGTIGNLETWSRIRLCASDLISTLLFLMPNKKEEGFPMLRHKYVLHFFYIWITLQIRLQILFSLSLSLSLFFFFLTKDDHRFCCLTVSIVLYCEDMLLYICKESVSDCQLLLC